MILARWLLVGALVLVGCGDDELAGGLRILSVSIYQGPEIALVRDAQLVAERSAPLVTGRPGRIVVTLQVAEGAEPRDVTVRVDLGDRVSGGHRVLEAPAAIPGGALTAVEVSLELEADALGPDTTFAAEVVEQGGFSSSLGQFAGVRQPAEGAWLLDVRAAPRFRVVVVPVDVVGPAAATTVLGAERLERWRATLAAWLPVDEVELELADTLTIYRDLTDPSGWSLMLADLAAWRADAGLADEVFVYGAFDLPDGSAAFAGEAATLAVEAAYWRVAGGILEPDAESENSLVVHELGHALGRSHAPCGDPGGPDLAYPYDGGTIGVPGLDLRDGQLRHPGTHVDFMSYCAPAFVSDYQFGGLFRSLRWLEDGSARRLLGRAPSFALDAEGGLRAGPALPLFEADGAPITPVVYGAGTRRQAGHALVIEPAHLGPPLLVPRDAPPWARTVALPGGVAVPLAGGAR